jgi:hypothetical protein
MRKVLYEGYRDFVRAYRQAAEKLRAGNRDAPFPLGRPWTRRPAS